VYAHAPHRVFQQYVVSVRATVLLANATVIVLAIVNVIVIVNANAPPVIIVTVFVIVIVRLRRIALHNANVIVAKRAIAIVGLAILGLVVGLVTVVQKRFQDVLMKVNQRQYHSVKESLYSRHLIVWVFLTEQCNCCCSYCENIPKSNQRMSLQNFEDVLNVSKSLLEKNAYHRVRLIFGGGEPLLVLPRYFDVLKAYTNVLNLKMNIIMNGTLITEKTAEFFAKNCISARVSLDHPHTVETT
jgi:sulfatase maturation enzyme AslB (radical SAM superfamily)